jgi:UPF0755 protein
MFVLGMGGAYWVWQDMQSALDRRIYLHESSELFDIERGASLAEIARRMQALGWLENDLYLRLEARRLKLGSSLKAGLYEIHDGTTPRRLLQKFVRGEVKIFRVTFIEGSRFVDMRRVLAGQRHLRQTLQGQDEAAMTAQIAPAIEHLEGRFFPSTYHYFRGDSDIDILRRAYTRMAELLAFHWQSRDPGLPYDSPDDALIMASIVEKETGREDERAQIAGVFVRRLERGMKLQTDPTVIYGMGEAFDGNLRRVDLETDTAYNTYTRHGLPPTPIAMPGEASIHAAMHPASGDFLYFVGKGDGSHHFSATLNEHNAAVRRYQLAGRVGND